MRRILTSRSLRLARPEVETENGAVVRLTRGARLEIRVEVRLGVAREGDLEHDVGGAEESGGAGEGLGSGEGGDGVWV